MILSQTARYALRAAVYLAEGASGSPVRVDQVAEDLQVPRNYLSKILHVLARTGHLTSLRGPKGGFQLARPPEDIHLSEIVQEFDSIEEDRKCLLGRAVCTDHDSCSAHEHWTEVTTRVSAFLRENTVRDLMKPLPEV